MASQVKMGDSLCSERRRRIYFNYGHWENTTKRVINYFSHPGDKIPDKQHREEAVIWLQFEGNTWCWGEQCRLQVDCGIKIHDMAMLNFQEFCTLALGCLSRIGWEFCRKCYL